MEENGGEEEKEEDVASDEEDDEAMAEMYAVEPEEEEEEDDAGLSKEEKLAKLRQKGVSYEEMYGTTSEKGLWSDDDEEEEDMDMDDLAGMEGESDSDRPMTKAEKEAAKMRAKIQSLEEAAVAEKEWVMKGEATSKQRPENSLLEAVLDFEQVSKPAPVVTVQHTSTLEDLIRQRILDEAWDDVQPKEEPRPEGKPEMVEVGHLWVGHLTNCFRARCGRCQMRRAKKALLRFTKKST